MLRFDKIKVEFYNAQKPIKIWDVTADNIVISKLVETKRNSKHLIGYLDEVIRALVFILAKMRRYVKKFKEKGGFMDDDRLLEKYKDIQAKIKEYELNANQNKNIW